MTGQVGSAQRLFRMGRDKVLPGRVFAYLHPKRNTPTYNIWIMGGGSVCGHAGYELAGEVLNFGAFLPFMGVNLAALRQFYFAVQTGRKRRLLTDALAPRLGALFCLWICWNLPPVAKIAGVLWLLLRFAYDAVKTRGFRAEPVMIDFSES